VRIFIDCEFNDYKGELVSMALVSDDGDEFYEALHCDNPSTWVAKHVIPILNKEQIFFDDFQELLEEWLMKFDSVHLVADWPEDIQHFCNALITGPGDRLKTPPLTMEVVRINCPSDMPHNALWDARGIRNHFIKNWIDSPV